MRPSRLGPFLFAQYENNNGPCLLVLAKQRRFFNVITDQVSLVQCYAIGRPRS